MTAVMKYAGAIALDDLEDNVQRAFGPREASAGGSANTAGHAPDRKNSRTAAAGRAQAHRAGPAVSHEADARTDPTDPPYSAILRFAAVNLGGFTLVGAAALQGWIAPVIAVDQTGLTLAIIVVFAAGLLFCGAKLWRISRETIAAAAPVTPSSTWAGTYYNAISGCDSGARAIQASTLQLRLGDWIAPIRHFANSLVLLGLIGTVIGFIIALSGVDPNAVSDVKSISPMVSTLLAGMSVALYTTLAGAALNLWLMVNHRMLAGAATRLAAAIVERGELDAAA